MARPAQWWQSSTVLTLIGTIATVLAFAGGIWAAFYASRPRRALTHSATMRRPEGEEQNNWVKHALQGEDERKDAAIVNFVLRGSGRLDVPNGFANNRRGRRRMQLDRSCRSGRTTARMAQVPKLIVRVRFPSPAPR
jgi:hypothetical protein